MKKFIGLICACAIGATFAPASAFAAGAEITGKYADGMLVITDNNGDGDLAVLNVYDDGVLCGSVGAKYTDGAFVFPIDSENITKTLRVTYPSDGFYAVTVTEEEALPEPSPEPSPEPTEKAESPTATATPTATTYPEVYEKALDAIHAPAIVEDVAVTMVDDEECYAVKMLYQGEKITVNIRNTVEITSAPQKYSSLCGNGADTLRKGDVIHFVCDLRGRVKNIQLILRPEFADYVGNGTDFDTVCGNDGYSGYKFGVAVKTYKSGILLADENGRTVEIDVNPNAFVYGISRKSVGDVSEVIGTGVSGVNPTYVDKSNFDDDGNVISWSDVTDEVYVLVREVRGEATEIVVLEN